MSLNVDGTPAAPGHAPDEGAAWTGGIRNAMSKASAFRQDSRVKPCQRDDVHLMMNSSPSNKGLHSPNDFRTIRPGRHHRITFVRKHHENASPWIGVCLDVCRFVWLHGWRTEQRCVIAGQFIAIGSERAPWN